MNILPDKCIKTVSWVDRPKSYIITHGSLLQLLLEHGDLLNIDISQGSVAKHLRCGGIFEYQLLLQIYDWVCQRILKID